VLQPLLVRPRAERRFEIVFGVRRYRGAAMAEQETVPVCIREMTDAQGLEAQPSGYKVPVGEVDSAWGVDYIRITI
jgi:ParB/RepB/Spo0J family partition protein